MKTSPTVEEMQTRIRFVVAMAREVAIAGQYRAEEALAIARYALGDHLKSEGIEFGDPAYDWSPDAGRELVHEIEISYWERRA